MLLTAFILSVVVYVVRRLCGPRLCKESLRVSLLLHTTGMPLVLETSSRRCLYDRGIQLGVDGSLLQDGMWVYVPQSRLYNFVNPMQQVDYFHGLTPSQQNAVFQTTPDEHDLLDVQALNPKVGVVACRICRIQRRWKYNHRLQQ